MCICNNRDKYILSQLEYKNEIYNSLRCKTCGFIQTKPSHEIVEDIYETGHYTVKSYFLIPFLINLLDYIYIYIIFIKNKVLKSNKVLDFGCGKGYFLLFLKKLGYEKLTGVETSPSRASFANRLTKVPISSQIYNGGKIMESTFDCITLLHVLEHIENPFSFLDIIIDQALNKNGILFIEVPNINSLASKIGKNTWAHFTPHFHINHFTPLSLKNYCLERGFKYKFESAFSFYNSSMGMTSAFLKLVGYKGVLFEDMKSKKIWILISFILLLPFSVLFEIFFSFFKRGSVIKFIIMKS